MDEREFLKSAGNEEVSDRTASTAVLHDVEDAQDAETIDLGGDFEDPTAPAKPSESRTFSETENPSISNENAENVDSQHLTEDGLSQETVEKLLFRLESGESHRVIAEETGISRTDLTAIGKFYRRWQAWNLAGTVDSQPSPGNDQEKVDEMAAKILELEKKNDRILTEKVRMARELKLMDENTAGLRKWVDRFKPEQDVKIQKLTEELAIISQQNTELKGKLERAGEGNGPLVVSARDYQDGYTQGREQGRDEMRLEIESQGSSWLTSLLIPLTAVAGIVAGACLVWVLS